MITIVNIDNNTFSINGITYKKIFVAVPAGSDSIRIVSAYDSKFEILPVTKFTNVTVDGIAKASQVELISSVIDIVLNRISPSEVTSKLDKDGFVGSAKTLKEQIDAVTFEGAKTYDTLQLAKDYFASADPKPVNGTGFKVSKVTDAANAGNYTFQSGEANGVRPEGGIALTEADKSITGPSANDDKLPTNAQVFDIFTKIKAYNGNQIFDKTNDVIYNDAIISSGGVLAFGGSATGGKVAEIVIDPAKENITLNGIIGIGTVGSFRGRFVDNNGTLIGYAFLLTNPITRAIPLNAAKIQFAVLNPSQAPESPGQYDTVMVNYGVIALPYYSFSGSSEKISKILDTSVVGSVDAMVGTQKVYTGNQIFDKATMLTPDFRIASGVLESASGYVLAQVPLYEFEGQPISVTGLIGSGVTGVKNFRFIDSNGVNIYNGYFRYDYDKLTPPKNAKILQFTIKVPADSASYADAVMVNYGFNALPFEAYSDPTSYIVNEKIDNKENYPKNLQSKGTKYLSPYYNEKFVAIGDSIIQQLSYVPLVAAGIGASFNRNDILIGSSANSIPMGVGGSTIKPVITGASGQNAGQSIYFRADYIKDFNPGVILLEGGQNDGRDASYNIWDAIYTGGEVSNTDPNPPSFVASMKGYLYKAITQNKNAKIAFISPMYTGSTPLTQSVYESYQLRNDTMRSVCQIMGVQFIDLLNNSGLNPFNNDILLKDGTHPTGKGGEIIAKYIISQL
tara:strand:- start:3549 stop:5756 length:2208 start_codon:yes stop_codon:yes gene_type:complete